MGAVAGNSEGVSVAEEEFWGLEVVLIIKSFRLLNESCPFPSSSSDPPTPIDVASELTLAFLSMLLLLEGLLVAAVSKSVAIPIPTLSTIVLPASLYKSTVLSAVIRSSEIEYVMSAETPPSYSDGGVISMYPYGAINPLKFETSGY